MLGVCRSLPRRVRLLCTSEGTRSSSNASTLVILSGWASSKAKTLTKYAQMYEEMGMPTKCIPLTIPELWLRPLSKKTVNTKMEEGPRLLTTPTQYLLHVFSGSSASHLSHILEKNSGSTLKGIIFDSSPVGYSLQAGLSAIEMLIRQGKMSPIAGMAIGMTGKVMNALLSDYMNRLARETWLSEQLRRVPHLYLYSKDDEVVGSDFIEEWAERQRERGVSVETHCWQESAHVRLYQDDPEKYRKQVIDFLLKNRLIET